MPTESKKSGKEEQVDPFDQMYQQRIQMTLSIVVISLATIALFGGMGYLIDHYLDSSPIFLIVLVILSFPVAQFFLYKRAKALAKHKNQ